MKHAVLAATLLLLAIAGFAQEEQYIDVLKSNAPTREKAAACRELASVGTAKAVPVLVSLLHDETLSHMARYALEPIDDASVDTALRSALGRLEGQQLVGVINSLGVRRDTKAVERLGQCLRQTDPAVSQAAARALGRISTPAAQVLQQALSSMSGRSEAYQLAVCEGLFGCAEAMPDPEAVAIYDRVRMLPNLPLQVQVAALRGAVLRRGIHGIPLLVETMLAESDALSVHAIGISVDVPGQDMTTALSAQLMRTNLHTQRLLLETLGNRGDATAMRAIVPLTRTGDTSLRIAAVRSLVQLGAPSSIPVLITLAGDPESTVSSAAQTGLISFPGPEADAAAVAWLDGADAGHRVSAIDTARQRRIPEAVEPLLKATGDTDTEVVNAAFKALGELAGASHIPGVVNAMLKTQAVTAAEAALVAICVRQSDKTLCTGRLLPGLAQAQGKPKLALLRVLRTVGDAKALAAVRSAASESDRSVQDTALRAMCDWPTADALPDLARLARTTTDTRFRILAIRGQLRLIPMQTESDAQKLSQVKTVVPLIDRTEEYRLALALLGRLPSAESLAMVMAYLPQAGLQGEASLAAVEIAENIVASHPAEVAEAVKLINTQNDKLAARVRTLLARVPKQAAEEGFISIFNGKDLTGWDGKPGWWTVEDGALTAESTPDKPCRVCNYLVWRDGQPADFDLRADFKISELGNSGIQIRSEIRPAWDTYGYQADMTGNGELIGFVYHHKYALIAGRGTKAIFPINGEGTVEQISDPATLLKHFKQDDWNTYRVVCHGPDITLYINGTLMCQISDHRVSEAARHGVIALQMHPGPPMKIQFKNLRIKTLDN